MANLTPRPSSFDQRSPSIMATKEAPTCIQKAMGLKERKPFTYTPGGLDLSEIKSEKMAKRLMRNAMCPGVPETPKIPKPVSNGPAMKTPMSYYNLPVAVFPMIQIPQNPKELLRRTSGPNRRESFESDVNSPKIQEKQTLPAETKCDIENKSEMKTENKEEKSGDVKLELKENIPMQTNDTQVKKTTTKIKKTKEKSGLKTKKKISSTTKTHDSTTTKVKEEHETNSVDLTICNNSQEEKNEEVQSIIKSTIEIKKISSKSNSFEEVQVNIKEETESSTTTRLKKDGKDSEDSLMKAINQTSKKANDSKEDIYNYSEKILEKLPKECSPMKESIIKENISSCSEKIFANIVREKTSAPETLAKDSIYSEKIKENETKSETPINENSGKTDTSIYSEKSTEKSSSDTTVIEKRSDGNTEHFVNDRVTVKESTVEADINIFSEKMVEEFSKKKLEVEKVLNSLSQRITESHPKEEPIVKKDLNAFSQTLKEKAPGDETSLNANKPAHNNICENFEITTNNYSNDEGKEQESEGDVTPKIDILTHQFESKFNQIPKTQNDFEQRQSAFSPDISKTDESCNLSQIIFNNQETFDSFRRENSNQIAFRRKSENIKSLNNDLDSLPSLNLCAKRFSFLRESPTKDDPFSILTGISAKLTLAGKDKNKLIDGDCKKENVLKKSDENIPKYETNKLLNDTKPFYNDDCDVNNSSLSQINGECLSHHSEDRKCDTNTWSTPKLYDDFTCKKEDNIPSWKKELLEIAQQKKEISDDSEYFKEVVEPPWRRELRELAQARVQRESAPSYNVWNKLVKAVETPPNDEPVVLSNPVWSQTVKPKTWKERKADLTREKEIEVPEWKHAITMRRNFMNSIINKSTSSSSSCSSPAREVRKTPEIMIEITGQPVPAQEQRPTTNGYTYPWESSSESSTTFSPEPTYERTPTPQSRNSPYNNIQSGMQSPVIAREFGTSNYNSNKRIHRRSCPFQSRSFKYLQMLTGTSDGYEDDEPFIPQSPQHAHLRPDNV